ncbi:hypothetical protein LJB87_00945 [Alistipes sp. OttesenSCG-928-L06]|nr:hypothetical protein [Alistipes sp. OttesenSCG-928-L06]
MGKLFRKWIKKLLAPIVREVVTEREAEFRRWCWEQAQEIARLKDAQLSTDNARVYDASTNVESLLETAQKIAGFIFPKRQ